MWCCTLGGNLIIWKTKEAKYSCSIMCKNICIAMAHTASELTRLQHFIQELGFLVPTIPLFYDNCTHWLYTTYALA